MSPDAQIVIGPNASLTVGQAQMFMGAMTLVGLGIAGGFAAMGFWPVVPFAGLELAALGAALLVSVRRNAYREVLWFCGEQVRVEFGLANRGASSRVELVRHWTRVLLEAGPTRHAPSRLILTSAGQRVEIGRCLTDEERERLKARIQELLKPGWRRQPGMADTVSAQKLPLGE